MNCCPNCKLKFICTCSTNIFCKHQLIQHSNFNCDPKRIEPSSPLKNYKDGGCNLHSSINYDSQPIKPVPKVASNESNPPSSPPEIFDTIKKKLRKFEVPNLIKHSMETDPEIIIPQFASICAKKNKVYIVCGQVNNKELYPNILLYNKKTEKLNIFLTVHTPRFMPSSVIFNDALYIIGGYGQDNRISNTIEKVNLLNKMSQVIDCKLKIEKFSATVFNNHIYICDKKRIIIFDPTTDNIVADFGILNDSEEILAIASCSCSIYIIMKNGIYILQDSITDFDLLISVRLNFGWTQQEILVYNSNLYYIDYYDESLKEVQIEINSNEFYSEGEASNSQFYLNSNKDSLNLTGYDPKDIQSISIHSYSIMEDT